MRGQVLDGLPEHVLEKPYPYTSPHLCFASLWFHSRTPASMHACIRPLHRALTARTWLAACSLHQALGCPKVLRPLRQGCSSGNDQLRQFGYIAGIMQAEEEELDVGRGFRIRCQCVSREHRNTLRHTGLMRWESSLALARLLIACPGLVSGMFLYVMIFMFEAPFVPMHSAAPFQP